MLVYDSPPLQDVLEVGQPLVLPPEVADRELDL